MARSIRNPRHPVTTEGKFGRLTPFDFRVVAPGETLKELTSVLNVLSLPVVKAMPGCTYDVWYYYVPFRTIWDGFEDFIMTGSNPPSHIISTPDVRLGERTYTTGWRGAAYEKIVNDYFRTDEDDVFVYSSSNPLAALKSVDVTSEMLGSVDHEAEDVTVDIVNDQLSISDIEDALAEKRYEQRMERMDGKYLSYLQSNGVRGAEEITSMPEYLGHGRRYVTPRKTVDPSDGFTKQNYSLEYRLNLKKPRFFKEHGYIVGVMSMRPKVHLVHELEPEYSLDDPKRWPHKGQPREYRVIEYSQTGGTFAGYSTENVWLDDVLWRGHTFVGPYNGHNVLTYNPSSLAEAKFPTTAWDAMVTDATLSGNHFTVEGFTRTSIATNLSRLKIA